MRGIRIFEARRAREFRKNKTSAESIVWRALRARELGGFKFVRQEPIGPYFVDFVCRERKLTVDIDGATHSTDRELQHDARREAHISARGYTFARFTNDDVYRKLEGVLETILTRLNGSTDA